MVVVEVLQSSGRCCVFGRVVVVRGLVGIGRSGRHKVLVICPLEC